MLPLRTGDDCGGIVNQLDVVSLRSINNPTLIQSVRMANPHGLTLVKDKLIVCEGHSGIKIFETSSSGHVTQISRDASFTAYDVIPHPDKEGIVLIIGDSGLIQFSMDSENRLSELSTIGF